MTLRTHHSPPALPRERGRAFGAAEASRIAATLAAYRTFWNGRAGGAFDPAPWGAQALAATRAHVPHLAEEIEGMAEGAGIDPALIAALNARTEILAILRRAGAAADRGECSAVIGLRPNAPPVMVQTWDWYHRFRDSWLVWHITQEDGRVTRTLTEYGIVGKAGVNDRGLGLLFTILTHAGDGAGMGLPVHVAARAALDLSPTLYNAAEWLAGVPVSASSSLNLAGWDGRRGQAITVELSPRGPGYALPDAAGVLVHTNHFLDPRLAAEDQGPPVYPDTLLRRDLLQRELSGGLRTAEEALAALDSHLGGDSATCCHRSDPESEDDYETLATVTLDLAQGAIDVHPGGPCTRPRAR